MPDAKKYPSMLRTLFSRNSRGEFSVDSLVPIKLSPKNGCTDDLYPLLNDIAYSNNLRHLQTIESILTASILPVVAVYPENKTIECLGTSFVISCSGILLTAAHLVQHIIELREGISKLNDNTYSGDGVIFGVMVPDDLIFAPGNYKLYPIEWAQFLSSESNSPLPIPEFQIKLSSDIAIAKIPPRGDAKLHQPLALIQKGIMGQGIEIGSEVFAVGYGSMKDYRFSEKDEKSRIEGISNFQLYVTRGKITKYHTENDTKKEVSSPGPCFTFAAKIPSGMSGSPIFDREGIYAHGVASMSLQNETGLVAHGYGSLIASSLLLHIKPLATNLISLQYQNGHGMPKISAPDL